MRGMNAFVTFGGALGAALSLSGLVSAQQCLDDADCADPLMICEYADGSDPAPCITPESCPEPMPGTCVVDPDRCLTQADCEEGFTCEVVQQTSPGCAPSADGSGCESPPPVAEVRECSPEPLTCEVDSDCPSGLVCMQDPGNDCAVVSGGSSTTGAQPVSCEPSTEKLCAWQAILCSSDADCGSNEECVALLETCAQAPCAPGEECDVECDGGSEQRLCFPAQRPCASVADCGSGEVCFDIGGETEDLPPWWEPGLGSTYCFSEGFVLAVEGRAQVAGLEDVGSAGESPAPGRAGGTTNESTDTDGSEEAGSGGGCTVASWQGTHPWGGLVLLLAGAAGVVRRRR